VRSVTVCCVAVPKMAAAAASLAAGNSTFTMLRPTRHLMTNAWNIDQFAISRYFDPARDALSREHRAAPLAVKATAVPRSVRSQQAVTREIFTCPQPQPGAIVNRVDRDNRIRIRVRNLARRTCRCRCIEEQVGK
jgi:hypothetical protein